MLLTSADAEALPASLKRLTCIMKPSAAFFFNAIRAPLVHLSINSSDYHQGDLPLSLLRSLPRTLEHVQIIARSKEWIVPEEPTETRRVYTYSHQDLGRSI